MSFFGLRKDSVKNMRKLFLRVVRIEKIDKAISPLLQDTIVEAKGQYLLPGIIDDQVHFRIL